MLHLVASLALQFVPLPPQLPAAAPQRFANVLVVDAAGGGAHTNIQSAITAARPGDTLLVKSGQYAGFVLADKGLSIVGDVGATVLCTSGSSISGVPFGQRALLQNLDIQGVAFTTVFATPLRVLNGLGAVRIEECSLIGGDRSRATALYASNSADVLLRACNLQGAATFTASYPIEYAGPGGTAIGSLVAAYQSTFVGGEGGSGEGVFGGFGGSGWTQTGGELRVEQGVFRGGDGGDNSDCLNGTGGDGGPGLRIDPPWVTPSVRATNSTFTGGAYGLHTCGYSGSDGPAVSGSAGLVTTTAPARVLTVPALVRDFTTVTFTMSGVVGESVFVLVSARDDRATSTSYTGVLHAAAPYLLRVGIGAIPASGVITYAWTIPDEFVPDGLSLTVTAQALHVAPSGAVALSNPVTMVVLDHAW